MKWEHDFVRYLAAKKSVDDRALNRNLWDALIRSLPPSSPDAPLRVIEVGAGIGTMIERLVMRGVLTQTIYTAIDAESQNIVELNRRLLDWGARYGLSVSTMTSHDATMHRTRLTDESRNIIVESKAIDVFDFIARTRRESADLLIAHAFLDLLDVPHALPQLLSTVKPGSLFYLTINFDGATIFEPTIDLAFDAEIERLYHQTMDERITNGVRSGDSRAGRHLFQWLRQVGAEIIQAGSSDWVVFSDAQGYPSDEAYFLHFIVDTLYNALQDDPALTNRHDRFNDWIAQRHRQIEEGTLVYIAHQIDFVGRCR
jgi:hypothetical protein